jgi:NADPH:quinone reductase
MRYQQVIASRRGGPEVLELRTVDRQPVPPGHALVRVEAAGVSFGDILLRVGVIPGGPKPPFTPGYDVVGRVEDTGPGVTDVARSQRVAALVRSGGYSEFAMVPASRLVPVPDGVDPVEAAAVALNYFIAYQMLHRVAKVGAGKHILIHGAGGGVGTALLQLGGLASVVCLGTGSRAKQDLIRQLGGRAIDYREMDFVTVARGLPAGGVDAAFDAVGGSNFFRSYRAVRRGGILVGYGQSKALRAGKAHRPTAIGGFVGGLILPKLIPDGRTTTFYNAWSLERKFPGAYREDLAAVFRLLADGNIRPVVARILPLGQAAQAQGLLERAEVSGKVVLRPEQV